ncbi:MAG: MFS transporter [Planctomycetota bacterium]|nr:MFS transporter [Planctomycetota bacterium]MDA1105061.1 MFS transporter [Planctomycetota bacterium]
MPPAVAKNSALALLALTFANSVGTSVLWNGMSFVLKHQFNYPEWKTMMVYVVTAIVYVGVAVAAGPILKQMRGRLSPRGLMGIAFAFEASPALVLPWASPEVALLYAAVAVSIAGALLWPVMEAYVAGGKHGHEMRRSIGLWCLTWMSAVTITLIAMGPLFLLENVAGWTVAGISLIGFASLLALPLLERQPEPHPHDAETVPAGYHSLLASARILLPVSYVLVSALSAMLPYVLSALQLPETWQTPLAATWLGVRLVVTGMLAMTHSWHGRWGAILLSAIALVGGFAIVAFGPTTAIVVAGLVCFGLGHAIAYYAALYYAMRVGSAGVDAGGTHEALIGAGYVAGPLVAAGGVTLAGSSGMASAVLLLCVVSGVPAMMPYLSWRRLQSRS